MAIAYWLRGAVSLAPTYTDSDVTFATGGPLTTREPVMKLESASSRALPRVARPSVLPPGAGVFVAVAVRVGVAVDVAVGVGVAVPLETPPPPNAAIPFGEPSPVGPS